jgi:hypothetical protein
MELNSLLHIPKTTNKNVNCSGSFLTILLNSLNREEDLELVSIEKHDTKKFTDVLKVRVNGKLRKTTVTGRDSVVKIFKRLRK